MEILAGIDEAGRGALAGPVFAGACVITSSLTQKEKPFRHWVPKDRSKKSCMIADSKKLSADEREEAFRWISENCSYGIGSAEASDIDTLGILGATEKAMQRALSALQKIVMPTYLLIDGRDHFWFDIPKSSVIRGDSLEPTIAAASILAKVSRDRWMTNVDTQFPEYGFAMHKGYGTPEHTEAIRTHSTCALHRQSFLKNVLGRRITPPLHHALPSTSRGESRRG